VKVPTVKLDALKRRMESTLAAFHRIPDECELDAVECERRRKKMVEAKLLYYIARNSQDY
jgi:hypothetical protein